MKIDDDGRNNDDSARLIVKMEIVRKQIFSNDFTY